MEKVNPDLCICRDQSPVDCHHHDDITTPSLLPAARLSGSEIQKSHLAPALNLRLRGESSVNWILRIQ